MSDCLNFLVKTASNFDALNKKEYELAANAIDMALKESLTQDGDSKVNVLGNLLSYATMLDSDGRVKEAMILDEVVKCAQELWPSAHDRDEKYDAKKNNEQTLFRALKDQPKFESVEPVLETMKGETLSLLTRYSPDYPGVNLLRISDGVYQDTMTRKVYDFNRGWVSETGQKHPGGSMAHQTPIASDYSGFNQVLESKNIRTRPR